MYSIIWYYKYIVNMYLNVDLFIILTLVTRYRIFWILTLSPKLWILLNINITYNNQESFARINNRKSIKRMVRHQYIEGIENNHLQKIVEHFYMRQCFLTFSIWCSKYHRYLILRVIGAKNGYRQNIMGQLSV